MRLRGWYNMDDNAIIDLFFQRSENAITETSLKYHQYCMTIAYNILPCHHDAEESVNDTYLTAWNIIPPNRPKKLSAFLGRITRNIALNKYDYYKAKKRNNEFDLILSELGDIVSAQESVETQYEAGQVAEAISAFLRCIDTENRNVFIRRYWYTDSISDIANRFGISESKIKSMLLRIRNKLKSFLEKEGIKI